MQVEPYLFFEGRCEEAVEFYRGALGTEARALDELEAGGVYTNMTHSPSAKSG